MQRYVHNSNHNSNTKGNYNNNCHKATSKKTKHTSHRSNRSHQNNTVTTREAHHYQNGHEKAKNRSYRKLGNSDYSLLERKSHSHKEEYKNPKHAPERYHYSSLERESHHHQGEYKKPKHSPISKMYNNTEGNDCAVVAASDTYHYHRPDFGVNEVPTGISRNTASRSTITSTTSASTRQSSVGMCLPIKPSSPAIQKSIFTGQALHKWQESPPAIKTFSKSGDKKSDVGYENSFYTRKVSSPNLVKQPREIEGNLHKTTCKMEPVGILRLKSLVNAIPKVFLLILS